MDLGEVYQIHSNYDTPTFAESEGAVSSSYILSFRAQFPDLAVDNGCGEEVSHTHTHTAQSPSLAWLNQLLPGGNKQRNN